MHCNLAGVCKQTVLKKREAHAFSSSLCVLVCDSPVSNRTSSSTAGLEAWLCLSWLRMTLVCAIDWPSQLQSTLPSRDQQEERQAAGLDLSLHGSSPDVFVCPPVTLSLPAPSYLGACSVVSLWYLFVPTHCCSMLSILCKNRASVICV